MSVRQLGILIFGSSILLMILGCSGSVGQGSADTLPEVESPLLNLLARIPDNDEIRNNVIIFSDHLAIAEVYPETIMPESWEAFESLGEDAPSPDSEAFPQFLWWRILESSRLSSLTGARTIGEEINDTVGVDFFDITRELYFGGSSTESIILQGEFELENVREAFTQLDFALSDNDHAEVWCSSAGCEAGGDSRRAQRQLGNPFGGESGRKQPIILDTHYLMSSISFDIIEQIIDVQRGADRSLASVSEYVA